MKTRFTIVIMVILTVAGCGGHYSKRASSLKVVDFSYHDLTREEGVYSLTKKQLVNFFTTADTITAAYAAHFMQEGGSSKQYVAGKIAVKDTLDFIIYPVRDNPLLKIIPSGIVVVASEPPVFLKGYIMIFPPEGNTPVRPFDDGTPPQYLPENYIEPDAGLLALTERKGMAAEYDSLRHAILFASEVMDFSLFPVMPRGFWLANGDEFYEYDRHNSGRVKWGQGMKTFRGLLSYANEYRNKSVHGLDDLIRRYGQLIKLLVPYEKYKANGWERMVEQLIVAYEDLNVDYNNFGTVYGIMCGDDGDNYPDHYFEKLVPFIRDPQMKAFIERDHGKDNYRSYVEPGQVNRWSVVWAYSFWGRRGAETPTNIGDLHQALKVLRDLYAPGSWQVANDKSVPPVEPYLTNDIRGSGIYPWKKYTDRMEFLTLNQDGDYPWFVGKCEDGTEAWLMYDFLNRNDEFNRGDVIDVTWYEGFVLSRSDEMKFGTCFADGQRIEEGKVTRFIKKYGGFPTVINDGAIYEDMQAELRDKLIEYMMDTDNPKIKEFLEILSGPRADYLEIGLLDIADWPVKPYGSLRGYLFIIDYNEEEDETVRNIINLIYDPEDRYFRDDVELRDTRWARE